MLKYQLHEGLNTIQHQGTLQLQYLDYQGNKLMGWFLSTPDTESDSYQVYVAITGESVHDDYHYVTSTQLNTGGGYYVVHAFD